MAGRPKRVFTDEQVQEIERFARIGSYNKTIAVGLNIPENTLKRHFGVKIRHWRAAGKLEMRESLHKQRDTSPQTAIFIAKNELGMTDKQIIQTEPVATEVPAAEQKAIDAASREYKLKLSRAETYDEKTPQAIPISKGKARQA